MAAASASAADRPTPCDNDPYKAEATMALLRDTFTDSDKALPPLASSWPGWAVMLTGWAPSNTSREPLRPVTMVLPATSPDRSKVSLSRPPISVVMTLLRVDST
ncbi:hypothetical protein G6F62_014735 [Rhizopus arrhizus]|nr:hypothetical protein G6F62_014735 [Rhizopus arrhizus]